MRINNFSINNYQYRIKSKNNFSFEKNYNQDSIKDEFNFSSLPLARVYFLGNIEQQDIGQIFEDVKNTDSIMEILSNSKLSPNNFKKLMFKITSDEQVGERFILEMIKEPKNSKENVRILNRKIGGEKDLFEWMLQPEGYQEAYSRYIDKLYSEANNPDDLIKCSPNWNIWKFKDKFGSDFSIGEPPRIFGEINNYRDIFHESLKTADTCNIQGVKFGEYIPGGLSGKAVRKLEANGKKYILKFQGSDLSHSNPELKDIASMHADSTFLNAQLDRYLYLNGYKQNAKLLFFDYKTNSALYEMNEGVNPQNIGSIIDVNKQLNTLNDYGVYYNDINEGNFLINNDKMSFIDSGEASFVDFFKPGVSGFHFVLPNLNGLSITDTAAAIQLSKML